MASHDVEEPPSWDQNPPIGVITPQFVDSTPGVGLNGDDDVYVFEPVPPASVGISERTWVGCA
ncbi:MAG: hypothetical protein R3F05_03335 [Planctomycetota bacterium]